MTAKFQEIYLVACLLLLVLDMETDSIVKQQRLSCHSCPICTRFRMNCTNSIRVHNKKKYTTPEFVEISDDSDDDFQDGYVSECRKENAKPELVDSTKNGGQRNKFNCRMCEYSTKYKSNLSRHNMCHKKTKELRLRCPEGNCTASFSNLNTMDNHLENKHARKLEVESLFFADDHALKTWRQELQRLKFSKYVLRGNASQKSNTYYCHRSYQQSTASKSTGKRNTKKIRSIRSERICTSRIKVVKTNDGFSVKYFKTHSGHTCDPGHVGLISPEKRQIAEQCKLGVPTPKILSNIRNNPNEGIRRINLTNAQDITNITRKYQIKAHIKLDENDATSVAATIKYLESNGDYGVFMYKKQGKKSKKYPTLDEDEFVLGYMNKTQEHLLKTFGDNIICIDGTHGTNGYGFEMTTIMTMDDQYQGFPNVFVFHSSKSEETYDAILKKLYEKVGSIQAKVFMSDDEPAFYAAWESNMGAVDKKLLCTWHVLRNWNKHLVGVETTLRRRTWVKLRAIMQELTISTFDDALNAFISEIETVDALKKFHGYFTTYYVHRKEEWAHCYRVYCGINTNMSLERMHGIIKYLYLNAKRTRRLDVSFFAVREFLADKQCRRLISIFRTTLTTKDKALRTRHKTSLDVPTTQVLAMADHWIIPSFKIPGRVYTLRRVNESCNCAIVCPQCATCIHIFRCDCSDHSVQTNMCKHIHLLCRYLKASTADETGSCDDDDMCDLLIDTSIEKESRHEEVQFHLKDLSKKCDGLEDILLDTKSLFEITCGLVRTLEMANILREKITSAKSLLACYASQEILSVPMKPITSLAAHANIEKQPRFILKKRKKTTKCSEESNHEIISSLVMRGKILPSTTMTPATLLVNTAASDSHIPQSQVGTSPQVTQQIRFVMSTVSPVPVSVVGTPRTTIRVPTVVVSTAAVPSTIRPAHPATMRTTVPRHMILLQRPTGQQVIVKTSQGMTLATPPTHIQGGAGLQGKAVNTGAITQSGQPVSGNTVLKILQTSAGGAKPAQIVGTNASGQQIVQIAGGQRAVVPGNILISSAGTVIGQAPRPTYVLTKPAATVGRPAAPGEVVTRPQLVPAAQGVATPTSAVRMIMVSSAATTRLSVPGTVITQPSVALRPRIPGAVNAAGQIYRTNTGQLISFPSGRLPPPIAGTQNTYTLGGQAITLTPVTARPKTVLVTNPAAPGGIVQMAVVPNAVATAGTTGIIAAPRATTILAAPAATTIVSSGASTIQKKIVIVGRDTKLPPQNVATTAGVLPTRFLEIVAPETNQQAPPEEADNSVSEIDQQEADALGVTLDNFGDAFTAEELMSGEAGVLLSETETTDGKLGLKGGSNLCMGSDLKFSFRNPPGMGLKGGSPYPITSDTESMIKIEVTAVSELDPSSSAPDMDANNQELENAEMDFSQMDTQVMDISLAFPDQSGIEPVQPQDGDHTSGEEKIEAISAQTLLDFDLSLPDDNENQDETENQDDTIKEAADSTDGTSLPTTSADPSMPNLDFGLLLPEGEQSEHEKPKPTSVPVPALVAVTSATNNALDLNLLLPEVPTNSLPTPVTQRTEIPRTMSTMVTKAVTQVPVTIQKADDVWYDVAHTKEKNIVIRNYYDTSDTAILYKPDEYHRNMELIKKIDLVLGCSYKFRLAAVNECGRGPWCESVAFKTCLPGYPGAPCSIKISKASDGALISWEPPVNSVGDIIEYSVYLAVKPNSPQAIMDAGKGLQIGPNLSFHRVCCGPSNQCTVPNQSLQSAQIDNISKPAIIFRIAAKNDKGYGPATQIRWLQDTSAPAFAAGRTALKTPGDQSQSLPAKKARFDNGI